MKFKKSLKLAILVKTKKDLVKIILDDKKKISKEEDN